ARLNSAGQAQFSAARYSVDEKSGTALITVTRTGGTDDTVTIDYATSNGSAAAGTDYTAVSGTLTFGPGVTSQGFSVPILDDGGSEGDQTVNLTLSKPRGGVVLGSPGTAVLTVRESGAGQSLQFSAA